jgi:hypothetical protein
MPTTSNTLKGESQGLQRMPTTSNTLKGES